VSTYTFTPPQVYDNPPILPDSVGPAKRLWRYFSNRARYVNVFALSDGSFVQDTATTENSNTNIPYPYNPYDPSAPYSSTVYHDYTLKKQVVENVSQNPWITKVYFTPTQVSQAEASSLTTAGYGALIKIT
jgi:hypothetical protein